MSASPASKRTIKLSPVAAVALQNPQFAPSGEAPGIQPAQPATAASGQESFSPTPASNTNTNKNTTTNRRKRKSIGVAQQDLMASPALSAPGQPVSIPPASAPDGDTATQEPKAKKSRTNTPWTPAEEQRLKQMRDAGNSWSEIAKTFPARTEGSVKKHWYKDMHYAEFGEDESAALLSAIKEYDANKWKVIGQKVGKPAKACEQYAKEHFGGKF